MLCNRISLTHSFRWASALCALVSLIITLPARAQFETVINLPPANIGFRDEIAPNTQVNVFPSGQFASQVLAGEENLSNNNIEVNVLGGSIGDKFTAFSGTTLNLSNGSVGTSLSMHGASAINVAGGELGRLSLRDAAQLTLTGGHVWAQISAEENTSIEMLGGTAWRVFYAGRLDLARGAVVEDLYGEPTSRTTISGGVVEGWFNTHGRATISGGFFGGGLIAEEGGDVEVAGGIFGLITAYEGANVLLHGGDLRLDGLPIDGLTELGATRQLDLSETALLTGVSPEGVPFALHYRDRDEIAAGSLSLQVAAIPPAGPDFIRASVDVVPAGIRAGQTLLADTGGIVPNHFSAAHGSEVTVQAGAEVGKNFEAAGANVSILGGTIDEGFDAFAGTNVNITDGTIASMGAFASSNVTMTGGHIEMLETFDQAEVILQGGTVNELRDRGGRITIAGASYFNLLTTEHEGVITLDHGEIDGRIKASSKSVVNVLGGTIAYGISAEDGSIINVDGGNITGGIVLESAGAVISGGASAGVLISDEHAHATYVGDEFKVDGEPVLGFTTDQIEVRLDLPIGSLLTGTLADGTPFAHRAIAPSESSSGTLTLRQSEIPPVGPATTILSNDDAPFGIRTGQTLIVETGGQVANNFTAAAGSRVEVRPGGQIGDNFEAVGAHIDISGGEVERIELLAGSLLYFSSGVLKNLRDAVDGSEVHISGGLIKDRVSLKRRSRLTVSGGNLGLFVDIVQDSEATISGGAIGDIVTVDETSKLKLVGNQFQIDGNPIEGLDQLGASRQIDLPEGALLTGVLHDGTPFVFTSSDRDEFAPGSLTLEAAELPPIGAPDISQYGIREGQFLSIGRDEIVSDNFTAGPGSRLDVHGTLGHNLEAYGARVNIYGRVGDAIDAFDGSVFHVSGTIGRNFDAYPGSKVTLILDGTIGRYARAFPDSEIVVAGGIIGHELEALPQSRIRVMSSGTVGNFFDAQGYSTVTLESGSIGDEFTAHSHSVINISGGSIGAGFVAGFDSRVTLSGGVIGEGFSSGADFTMSGGLIAGNSHLSGRVLMTGGTVDQLTYLNGAAQVAVRGGVLAGRVLAFEGSETFISGGHIGPAFIARDGSSVHLIGKEFEFGGVPISPELGGAPLVISARNAPLSGTLLDGSTFRFDLQNTNPRQFEEDYFSPDAKLTITVLSNLPGDFNSNGVVEQGDLDLVLINWGEEFFSPYFAGWFNDLPEGNVDQSELDLVLLNWGSSLDSLAAVSVPEPASAVLASMLLAMALLSRSSGKSNGVRLGDN